MRIIYQLLFAFAALTLIQSCSHDTVNKSTVAIEIIPVRVMPLQKQLTQLMIAASGQFTTDDETFLSFKMGGIVNQILVKEGDAVRRGELVATLNLTEINAQVQQVRFNYEKAARDYNRYRNLYRDSVATLEQMQNAKSTLDIVQQQLRSAQFNQGYSQIRATANGYVLKRFSNPGQMVNAGDPVLQINGAHEGKWILKVNVSDKDWSAIKTGDSAAVETDAMSQQTIEAVVSKKEEAINQSTGTFTIDLLVKGKAFQSLASGLFGKAMIYPSEKSNSWILPYDALMDGDAGEAFVFVTDDHKTARKVKVKVASVNKGNVIISSGLEGAKSIIISGSPYLKEGSLIKVLP